MAVMWIIWLPVFVFFVIFLYRFFNNSNSGKSSNKESPLDILKRRYANGELSTAEYEERKKNLEDNN
jgi:putative membrane protein